MFNRHLKLNPEDNESFFLWGPRQTGKSTLLNHHFPHCPKIDLLQADTYRRYLENPELLREFVKGHVKNTRIIIDEIQKVPALLDEVHGLIENSDTCFGLCGSSARKVKRGHANLLGGRAVRFELFGLTSHEIGEEFELEKALNSGYIPNHYLAKNSSRKLAAYVTDYLKEEIAVEGLVRNLPVFGKFLNATALSDTETINFTNIASECGVTSKSVKAYYEILEDTLLGSFLPAYQKKLKRRMVQAPKFYFFDVGVVNYLSKRKSVQQGTTEFGKAFENLIFHELRSYCSYEELLEELSYWRTSSGFEVDFIIGDFDCAIEVKSSKEVKSQHLKSLRKLSEETKIKKSILISLDPINRVTEDNIELLHFSEFSRKLWNGELF